MGVLIWCAGSVIGKIIDIISTHSYFLYSTGINKPDGSGWGLVAPAVFKTVGRNLLRRQVRFLLLPH